jgi:molybdate transport system permease protein|uniref:Molybdenum transport system permease protein ModB n=1 Tax=uncultured organism TaxID=155900 RepID=A0A7L9QBX7_9ZZZZ|nr:molybdenum transport system permease protein ModB [uncultured organism]
MFGLTPDEWEAIVLTLKVASAAVIVSLPLALAVAWLLSYGRFPGKIALEALVSLPLVLPPVVTGYALLLLLGRHGALGGFLDRDLGIVLAFRWTGAAVAAAVMGFPFMVRGVRLSLDAIDRDLEGAASSLGAPGWLVFLTITLPLAIPGILSGAVLAFARSLGEFGATITFVASIPGETRTISSTIYALLQTPDGDRAVLRLCLISVTLSVGALVLSEILIRAGRRRLAR